MKALSVKQPWASLICTPREDNPLLGIKDIENRTWNLHFRGKVYIHASAKPSEVVFDGDQREVLKQREKPIDITPLSAIIGEVEIVDCVVNHSSIWAEKTKIICQTIEGDNLYKGKPIYNWVLANPVLYDKPILNVKGKLSFWYPDNDIVECIGCSQKFDAEFMKEDDGGEKFCDDCWNELSPLMIKETKECEARDKLAEFGKVVTVNQSDHDFEFLITDGFSQKAKNTFACMEACHRIAESYHFVKKCITEENKFHLILTKEKINNELR